MYSLISHYFDVLHEIGGAVQKTHHWSPLNEEVKFVSTQKDSEFGIFLCAKDRHVFPWVDVNVRFGFIEYENNEEQMEEEGESINTTCTSSYTAR